MSKLGETLDTADIQLEGLGAAPWVDRLLNTYWDRIEAVAPEGVLGTSTMPLLHPPKGRSKKVSALEYGCGSYGCVMPTGDSNIVCKVTSDESEAFFIACALQIGELPDGIVQYIKVLAFPAISKRRDRPTFILWREAARDVGYFNGSWGFKPESTYDRNNIQEIYRLVSSFKDICHGTREVFQKARNEEQLRVDAEALEDWAWGWGAENWDRFFNSRAQEPFKTVTAGMSPAKRFAAGLRLAHIAIEIMENTYRSDSLGRALGFYLEHGLLLCDVHHNNLGRVDRAEGSDGGTEPLVITDPGHALALDARWAKVRIEEL